MLKASNVQLVWLVNMCAAYKPRTCIICFPPHERLPVHSECSVGSSVNFLSRESNQELDKELPQKVEVLGSSCSSCFPAAHPERREITKPSFVTGVGVFTECVPRPAMADIEEIVAVLLVLFSEVYETCVQSSWNESTQ